MDKTSFARSYNGAGAIYKFMAFLMFVISSACNIIGQILHLHILTCCSKPLIVPSLALFCWILLKNYRISGLRVTTLISALTFGAIGDILLMFDGQAAFLAGLTSFLIGHIFYLVTIGSAQKEQSGSHFGILRIVPVVMIFILAMTAQLFKVKGFLGMAVTVYAVTFAFCINAGMQNAVIKRQRLYWITVAGYVLFVISDTILAIGKFTEIRIHASGFWIMLTYILAQFLIALSLTLVEIRQSNEIKVQPN